jgi:hypothetical protein
MCGSTLTADQCRDPALYRPGGISLDSTSDVRPDDLRLPYEVDWPALPSIGPGIVVGGTPPFAGTDATRLRGLLKSLDTRSPHLLGRFAVLHGRDADLRRLGPREGLLGTQLRDLGVPLIVGPGFSTWWEWSPFDSLIAMARSAAFAVALASHLPTIPTVVWRTDADLRRWAHWINATSAPAFALDLGTLRSAADWQWAIGAIRALDRDLAGADVKPRLVVNGPSTLSRLTEVRLAWDGPLAFASQAPHRLASGGKRLTSTLGWSYDAASRDELAIMNRHVFLSVAAQVAGTDERGSDTVAIA